MKDNRSPERDFHHRSPGFPVTRREFLKIGGSGLFVFFTLGPSALLAQGHSSSRPGLPDDFNAFLRIGEDGSVSCFTGKIEMGQGVVTSLAQMLADELDVSLDAVRMVMGDTDLCPWDMGTFGSRTTRFFGPPLREAGAQARSVLLELAAERLDAPVESLRTENGVVFHAKNEEARVSYAELTRGKRIERRVSGPVSVKKPSEFKIMGTPVTRTDALDKVTGKAKYAGDVRVEGMVYAKVLRPPAHGAKLVRVDVSRAEEVEGVQVVRDGDLVAVLHRYPDVAEWALARVEADFLVPESDLHEDNIHDHLLKVAPAGEEVARGGDL